MAFERTILYICGLSFIFNVVFFYFSDTMPPKPKPRNKVIKRPRIPYDKSVAIQGAQEYLEGKHKSFRTAGLAMGGIPESTIRDYHTLLVATSSTSPPVTPKVVGRRQTIQKEDEDKLAAYCLKCADMGSGKTKEYIYLDFLIFMPSQHVISTDGVNVVI